MFVRFLLGEDYRVRRTSIDERQFLLDGPLDECSRKRVDEISGLYGAEAGLACILVCLLDDTVFGLGRLVFLFLGPEAVWAREAEGRRAHLEGREGCVNILNCRLYLICCCCCCRLTDVFDGVSMIGDASDVSGGGRCRCVGLAWLAGGV